MIRRIFLILLPVIFTINNYAQNDLDRLMTKTKLDCEDIAFNSSQLYIDYIKNEKYDSAKIIIDYWESKCNLREPILRAKIILSLITNDFSEELYDSTIFDYIYLFEVRESYSGSDNYEYYEMYRPYFGHLKWDSDFDKFTKEIAVFLLAEYPENSIEKSFAYLYNGNIDGFYEGIKHHDNRDKKITSLYEKKVDQFLKLPDSHLAGFVGLRVPDNKMSTLGVHPEFGYNVGLRFNRLTGDFTLAFSVLGTPEKYTVYKDQDTILSDYYLGAYLGLDFQYDIYRLKKNEVSLLTGIGWDGFDTDFDWNESNIKSTSSYNLNFGIGYRYYFKNRKYLGIQYKYNFVDYSLNNVTDFQGNIHLVRFVFGGFSNEKKYEELKDLRYEY